MLDLSVNLSDPAVQALANRPVLRAGKIQLVISAKPEIVQSAAGDPMLRLKLRPAAPTVVDETGTEITSDRVTFLHNIMLVPKGGMTLDKIVANLIPLIQAGNIKDAKLNEAERWSPQLEGLTVNAMISVEEESVNEKNGKTYPRGNSIRYFLKS